MDVPNLAQQVIHCHNCGHPLRALRGPRCNWCGVRIPAEDFAAIAAQSQRVMAQPTPPPLPTITSDAQRAEWGWGRRRMADGFLPRAVQSFQPATPGQARLRLVVIVLFGLLAAVEITHHLYALWLMHRVIQMLPRH